MDALSMCVSADGKYNLLHDKIIARNWAKFRYLSVASWSIICRSRISMSLPVCNPGLNQSNSRTETTSLPEKLKQVLRHWDSWDVQ